MLDLLFLGNKVGRVTELSLAKHFETSNRSYISFKLVMENAGHKGSMRYL